MPSIHSKNSKTSPIDGEEDPSKNDAAAVEEDYGLDAEEGSTNTYDDALASAPETKGTMKAKFMKKSVALGGLFLLAVIGLSVGLGVGFDRNAKAEAAKRAELENFPTGTTKKPAMAPTVKDECEEHRNLLTGKTKDVEEEEEAAEYDEDEDSTTVRILTAHLRGEDTTTKLPRRRLSDALFGRRDPWSRGLEMASMSMASDSIVSGWDGESEVEEEEVATESEPTIAVDSEEEEEAAIVITENKPTATKPATTVKPPPENGESSCLNPEGWETCDAEGCYPLRRNLLSQQNERHLQVCPNEGAYCTCAHSCGSAGGSPPQLDPACNIYDGEQYEVTFDPDCLAVCLNGEPTTTTTSTNGWSKPVSSGGWSASKAGGKSSKGSRDDGWMSPSDSSGDWGGWGSAKSAKSHDWDGWGSAKSAKSHDWDGWGSAKSAKSHDWDGWGSAKSAKSHDWDGWGSAKSAKSMEWMGGWGSAKSAKSAKSMEWMGGWGSAKSAKKSEWGAWPGYSSKSAKSATWGGWPVDMPTGGSWSSKGGKSKSSKAKCTKKSGGGWWPKPETDSPVLSPSLKPSTSVAPSTSLVPSINPTNSIMPSTSEQPSEGPSTSQAPSESLFPSFSSGAECDGEDLNAGACTDPTFPYCCAKGSKDFACRPNVEACQKGPASDLTCLDADPSLDCDVAGKFCCKYKNGPRNVFKCVDDEGDCP